MRGSKGSGGLARRRFYWAWNHLRALACSGACMSSRLRVMLLLPSRSFGANPTPVAYRAAAHAMLARDGGKRCPCGVCGQRVDGTFIAAAYACAPITIDVVPDGARQHYRPHA